MIAGSTEGIAHIGLLVNFLGTRTRAAVCNELFGGEVGAFRAIDDSEEAEFDSIGHGHAEI